MNWVQVLVHLDWSADGINLNFLELLAETVNIAYIPLNSLQRLMEPLGSSVVALREIRRNLLMQLPELLDESLVLGGYPEPHCTAEV